MPVRKVKGGYKWGSKGKVYKTKAKAEIAAARTDTEVRRTTTTR